MTATAENTSTESATIAAEVEMRVRSHPMAPASNLICHPGTMIPQIEQLNIDLADIKLDLTEAGSSARRHVKELKIAGQVVRYSDRFGNSLSGLIGQSKSIFRLFEPDEVISRALERGHRAACRVTLTTLKDGTRQVLAATGPKAVAVPLDDYMTIMADAGVNLQHVRYADGELHSPHTPSLASSFMVGSDVMENKFTLSAPLDGYGQLSSFLSILRQVCSNGAVAMAPAFRTSIPLGDADKEGFNPGGVLRRFLNSFNHEEGYKALSDRFVAANKCPASVDEYFGLRKTLNGFLDTENSGTRGCSEWEVRVALDKLAGDIEGVYGSANLDQVPAKVRRSMPTKMSVYRLINFATEVATHYAHEGSRRRLALFVGPLLAATGGFDLENMLRPEETPEAFYLKHIVGANSGVAGALPEIASAN